MESCRQFVLSGCQHLFLGTVFPKFGFVVSRETSAAETCCFCLLFILFVYIVWSSVFICITLVLILVIDFKYVYFQNIWDVFLFVWLFAFCSMVSCQMFCCLLLLVTRSQRPGSRYLMDLKSLSWRKNRLSPDFLSASNSFMQCPPSPSREFLIALVDIFRRLMFILSLHLK